MTIKDDENSAYAPIRQRGMFWWKYAQTAANEGHINPVGMISPQLPDMIMNHPVRLYLKQFEEVVKGQENASFLVGVQLAKVMMLRHWIPLAGQYELCGRQIFDLHDSLVEMLGETDLGECTLENWNAPYEAFYVRFGKQNSMSLPFEEEEREYLDGAFVARTPYGNGHYRLKFGFTTVKESGKGVMLPGYFIDLLPEEQKLPVADAIEASLKRKIAEYDADDVDGTEQSRAINSYRRDEAEQSASLLRAGATLLVNSLFYLEGLGTSTPEPSPGRDTPPALVARWHQLDPKKRRKEKSNLTAQGYTVVRLVGQEVADSQTRVSSAGTLRVHWRRGHWRIQRHGQGLVERKRIWIKPVLVGSELHGGDELPGHIYVAGSSALN